MAMHAIEVSPTAFVQRPMKVVVIGAGISGIQIAHEIKTKTANIDLQVFEKNSGAGGTWFENRYPGCTCDVPAHTYQFSWAPNPSWSKFFAPAGEILAYLNSVIDAHHLRQYMQFNHQCTSATWLESISKWEITFQHTLSREEIVRHADVLVYAVGRLNNYKIPFLEGQDDYQGVKCHTADWPEGLSTSGKRMSVIGNGASGIQCVAQLQSEALEIFNFARNPTWLGPQVLAEDGSPQMDYTVHEQKQLETDPRLYYEYRMTLERQVSGALSGLWKGTSAQRNWVARAESHLQSKVQDHDLARDLRPDFDPGCRRFTPGDRYLSALQQPNVHYIKDTIMGLTENGVKTAAGHVYESDIIVFATGFEPYSPRFPVVGRDGTSLTKVWGSGGPCESYMATMVASFPNFFAFNPPNCPVNGSAFPGIERASHYMLMVMKRLQTDCLRSVCVKPKPQQDFNKWIQSRMPEMVWSGACKSWYKNENGKVVVPWPGTTFHYYQATEIVRWEDFDLVFADPDRKYLSFGNGVTEDRFKPDLIPWVHLNIPQTRRSRAVQE